MDQRSLQALFDAQYAASRNEVHVPWSVRRDRLQRLLDMVKTHSRTIAETISRDFGQRAVAETLLLEVFPTLEGVRHALRHGESWMKPRRVPSGLWFFPAQSRIVPQAKGVVGIIAPWNYPLYLTVGPLLAALVAGNRALIKMSEFAPAFAAWLQQTVPDYFAADEVAVVCGEREVAEAFAALPFDHLLFTGSTAVGRKVMQAAAANLTPVTLELGGKSPCVVLDDADLAQTAARIMAGKLLNAGQTCIAPDYALLPQAHLPEFIEHARAWVQKHYPQLRSGADFTRIINERQYARLRAWLDEAAELGASIISLGDDVADAAGRFLPPTLVTGLPAQAKLLNEEIFGPILPVVTYRDEAEALAFIRERERPLALYGFSSDAKRLDDLLHNTVSGGASLNETIYHVAQENLPFGGIGASGMGAYHGKAGFDTFTHYKSVFIQSKLNGTGLLAPPYGKLFQLMMKVLLR
ncbi:MAG: coniferyl aldehyde dehydrogenase [Neisseria sp.]|nr:coniferyl aldehyde dehydrogenase [Neisseria sp.]